MAKYQIKKSVLEEKRHSLKPGKGAMIRKTDDDGTCYYCSIGILMACIKGEGLAGLELGHDFYDAGLGADLGFEFDKLVKIDLDYGTCCFGVDKESIPQFQANIDKALEIGIEAGLLELVDG